MWKSILRSRTLLKKGIRWNVGNGKNITLWRDNWVDSRNLVEVMNKDIALLPNPKCTVSKLIKADRTWNVNKLRQITTNAEVVEKVLGTPLPQFNIDDSFC